VNRTDELEALFEISPDLICVAGEGGDILRANAAWEEVLGYPPEELVGMNFTHLVHPDDKVSTRAAAAWTRQGHPLVGFVNRYRHRNGEYRFLEWSAQSRGGRLFAAARDITDRLREEEARRELDERLRKLTRQLPGVVYQFRRTPDGRYSLPYASDVMKELYGVEGEGMLEDATPLFRRLHPDDLEAVQSSILESAGALTEWRADFRVLMAGGAVRWHHGQAVPELEPDGAVLWHGFITDITSRKEREAALQESEERWQFALESAGDGVWDWIVEDGTVFYSSQWKEMLGYAEGEIHGTLTEWEERIHPDDRKAVEEDLQRHLTGEVPLYRSEHRLRARDGSFRWILDRGKVVRWSEDGRPLRMIGTQSDLTERRGLEAARLALQRRLQESERTRSLALLAQGVAHDFNNLLVVIMGSLELIRTDLPPDSPLEAVAQEGWDAARRAAHLTRQILTFSGSARSRVQDVLLNELVVESLGILRSTVPPEVEVTFQAAPGLAPVPGDPAQLQQMVTNLVTNAFDALEGRGGAVTVATAMGRFEEVPLKDAALAPSSTHGRFVSLEVRDTGEGMDAATMRHMFDPFFTTRFTGRGLGLAAVLGIVRGHGGAILVHSEPGEGTGVEVLLPLDRRPDSKVLGPKRT